MYSSTRPALPPFPPSPPSAANANYPFLANPPKHKHKPHPITVRCAPPRTHSRSASSRRRASISGSPAFQTSFLVVDTPTPTSDTPKTPHLVNYGYTAAFSTSYPRRGSLPDTPRSARRAPASPKRVATAKSPPSSPKRAPGSASYKRRYHRVPSPTSPFAPPSPTRSYTRPRARSTTRIPAPTPSPTPIPVPRTPKLSKIRSLTSLRSRSPSPIPPSRTASPMYSAMNTQKHKRSKRSATPARSSPAFTKYRPMPFIQQMQVIQFMDGGSLESHIRRHHVHAGQGTTNAGFSGSQDAEVAHGYAFTDERGMIWFDEEEEWEFACLLPQARPQCRRGIKRLLGKRREEENEEEWEDFAEEAEGQNDEDVDADVLLAREDDDLRARQDDLAAFGGALDGAWGRDRPERSVLKLPQPKRDCRRKRQRARQLTPPPALTVEQAQAQRARNAVLKKEFLATAFAPSPARTSPSPAPSAPPTRATSPFRLFTRPKSPASDVPRKSNHRHARSIPHPGDEQSFASLGASMRGGSVLDSRTTLDIPRSPTVQWASPPAGSRAASPAPALLPSHEPMSLSRQPSPVPPVDARLRSISPPPAAARRLGIDLDATVSLQPIPTKKSSFMTLSRFKGTRRE